MLVICNGAAKSGSTWLYNIVCQLREFQWPDASYISSSNSKHPTIKEKHLERFLKDEDFTSRDLISKNHYGKPIHREQLLSSPHTRVLGMSRDTRDVIVSSYYDACRRSGFDGSFEDYYWIEGRLLVEKLWRYHQVWGVEHPQVFNTSFEALKQGFETELSGIAAFLDVQIDEADIERIKNETSLNALRSGYSDDAQYNTEENPFFRKGEIGDWENHFSKKILKDFNRVSERGIGRFDRIYLMNRLREKLAGE